MKKLLFTALALAAFISCAEIEERDNASVIEWKTVTLNASSESQPEAQPASKVALSDAGAFSWSANDSFYLGGGQFILQSGDGTASASFSGQVAEDLQDGAVAIYPYDIRTSDSQVTLPAQRDWVDGNTFSPMVGAYSAAGESVSFTHLGGVVKVTLTNIPDNANKFNFIAYGQKINGVFDIQDGAIATSPTSEAGEDTYTVTFTKPSQSGVSTLSFYVPLPTGSYSKGFKINVTNSGGKILAEYLGYSPQTVSRATIKKLPAIDLSTCLGQTLKVLSWNVGKLNKVGTSTEGGPVIAEIIANLAPDVMCLQELELNNAGVGNEVDYLKTQLESKGLTYKSIFQGAKDNNYGNIVMWKTENVGDALVTKGQSVNYYNQDNTFTGERRSYVGAEFSKFVFISTELDHNNASAREWQRDKLNTWADDLYDLKTNKLIFLGGGFNATNYPSSFYSVTGTNPEGLEKYWRILTADDIDNWQKKDGFVVYKNGLENTFRIDFARALTKGEKTLNYSPLTYTNHNPVYMEITYWQ